MAHILIVEDEAHIAHGIAFNLEAEGHHVTWVDSAAPALAVLTAPTCDVDLVILDVMMEGMDGMTLCRRLRELHNYVPVLMLTARDRVADRVEGLESGADDYLVKPFVLKELLARVTGLLRRQRWNTRPEATPPPPPDDVLEFGGNRVHFKTFEAVTSEGLTKLTAMEVAVLRYLWAHEGEVVSRKALLEKVWGMAPTVETRTVDNFIVRLRKLFERDPRQPRHFISVRGVGYQFKREGEEPAPSEPPTSA